MSEWTDAVAKLINLEKLLLKMELFDLQEYISLQVHKILCTKESWSNHLSENKQNCRKLVINLDKEIQKSRIRGQSTSRSLAPHVYVKKCLQN